MEQKGAAEPGAETLNNTVEGKNTGASEPPLRGSFFCFVFVLFLFFLIYNLFCLFYFWVFVFFGVVWRFLVFFGVFDIIFGFLPFFCVGCIHFR